MLLGLPRLPRSFFDPALFSLGLRMEARNTTGASLKPSLYRRGKLRPREWLGSSIPPPLDKLPPPKHVWQVMRGTGARGRGHAALMGVFRPPDGMCSEQASMESSRVLPAASRSALPLL